MVKIWVTILVLIYICYNALYVEVYSLDVFYLVNIGAASWFTYFVSFMLPTLIGNIIGGVSLVAALNFAQVASRDK